MLAAVIRSSVRIAVPEGVRSFWSWCSSMMSAVSNHGAAISAKRIIGMAPIAKLGHDSCSLVNVAQLVDVVPRRTRSSTTAWTPFTAHQRRLATARVVVVKSPSPPGAVATRASTWRRRSDRAAPSCAAQVHAGVMGIDGGDEVERRIVGHGGET